MADEPTSEGKPQLKSLRGIITDVQSGLAQIEFSGVPGRLLQIPFQFVFVKENTGLEHILVNAGNQPWKRGGDVRFEYEAAPDGRIYEFDIVKQVLCRGGSVAGYAAALWEEHGPSVEAEGLIKSHEYAIRIGSPGGK